jgi:hypothetical protein
MRLLLLTILISFVSCAKTDKELVDSAKQEAKFYLSKRNCTKARAALNEVSRQDDDAVWLGLMASTYACDAGYSELDTLFNSGDLGNLDSANLLTTLAAFSSSNETSADSAAYTNLKTAVNYILAADGLAQPSAATKLTKFGTRAGTDLNMQALYMILVITGKYFAYYGNTDTNGVKGAGSLGNDCIFSYTAPDAVDFVAGEYGANTCSSTGGGEGSDDLEAPVAAATIKTRLCEGIIWFNNLLDILKNITLSSNPSLGDLSQISTVLDTALTVAATGETTLGGGAYNDDANGQNAIATLKDITGQDECEAIHEYRIQKYHAILFETLLP